jgi:hypothetical protein
MLNSRNNSFNAKAAATNGSGANGQQRQGISYLSKLVGDGPSAANETTDNFMEPPTMVAKDELMEIDIISSKQIENKNMSTS